ncbi:MAG: DUF1501 domain-containing protein [Akkermansiaceae bacterium]|jgi:uncharacterized protein (DUF1501 family)|nr:DUF1501 domain-containing protein [Akkermansiaceae bacterium]
MDTTRRQFLRATGTAAIFGSFAPGNLFAESQPIIKPVTKGRTLVAVFLRGGIDGLNLVVPHGDQDYYKHRKNIAIAKPARDGKSALDLDGFFGLHPFAASLEPLFKDRSAVALQAVGYEKNTRSHFEEQDRWETGVIGNSLSSDGWLNRHLASSTGHGSIRAVSIGGSLPRILRGRAPAYAIRGIADLSMPRMYGDADVARAALETAYCTRPEAKRDASNELLSKTAAATLEGTRQLEAIAKIEYKPANGAKYGTTSIAKQFLEAARLIKSGIGTELIELDYGGWDTHNAQGGAQGGYANRLKDLTDAMATFTKDLGDQMNDVLVLTLSDFGRTVAENGTSGTDHGWANCMIAIGGGVAKNDKPVLGEWPGLAPENLYQKRDLKHTTDFRDVLGEVVSSHLGNENIAHIIPDHKHKAVGLL